MTDPGSDCANRTGSPMTDQEFGRRATVSKAGILAVPCAQHYGSAVAKKRGEQFDPHLRPGCRSHRKRGEPGHDGRKIGSPVRRPKSLDTANAHGIDAGQSTRDHHFGGAALPRPHQDRCAPGGLGQRHAQMTAWLDKNRGADGRAMTPSGMRSVLNDALWLYFEIYNLRKYIRHFLVCL